MMKRLFVASLVVACCMFTTGTEASAWWSHGNMTHAELAFLSYPRSEMEPSEVRVVELGSMDPDEGKRFKDHSDTKRRSIDSFCVALRTAMSTDRTDQAHLSWVTRRQIRAFHYLQDRGDPTKGFSSSRTDFLRGMAHRMLIQGSFKRGNVWSTALAVYKRGIGSADFDYIFSFIARRTESIHNNIEDIYNRGLSQQARDRLLYQQLVDSFALIKVCQDRMLQLLERETLRYRNGQSRCNRQ